MANLIGTDVSFYQDDPQTPQGIDFAKMRKNAGYVIIRAGQNLWADRDFKANWREAKLAGLPRGSYWFYDSRIDPKKQAELWVSLFGGDYGELPLWADFEDNYGGAFKGWRHWYNFIERIKELAPGREIGVYTAYYYWLENTVSVGIPTASLNYFKRYPLWIANYGVSKPLVPKPWDDWTLWQFTDNGDGTIYGVESKNIDLNYFNGDAAAFKQRFNVSDMPIPDPQPLSKYFRVTVPSLKVRSGAGLTFPQVGSALLNETVEEIGANADRSWINIRKLDGSLTGWSFGAYLQRISAPLPEPTPDPEPTPEPEPTPTNSWYRVTTTSLRMREGPDISFPQVGSLAFNEVAEEIGANTDRSWLHLRKANGSLSGWCTSEFLQKTTAPAPTPTPEPTPEPEPEEPTPEPEPTVTWHRVTTSSLRVRQGPGTTFAQIGSILFNEVVEEIGANADRSWLNIRKADRSLTGWCASEFLQKTAAPTPEPPSPTPDQPPEEEDTNWYRVTTSSLKVREGAGLEYDSIGLVYFGELVEKIGAATNGSWMRIRNQSGSLIGWVPSSYLISVHTPEPSEPPVSSPIPEHTDKTWYRVNTTSLNVREQPSASSKIVGIVMKNDTIPALDDTTNANWVKVERLDGLTGWCSKSFLISLGKGRPTSITQNLFKGVTYLRKDLASPRPIVVHVMAIDLQTLKLEFLVTPSPDGKDILCTRTTSKFLEEFKLHIAINGGYYSYLDASFASKCSTGDAVRISDYAASRGTIYSPKKTIQPVVYIRQKNQVSFNKVEGSVFNAISGDRLVVVDGKVVKNLAALDPAPRTAIGLSKNARWLTLMVVDGRQTGYSEGVTLPELGELLISYGVFTGVNMDGGGSSTMVMRTLESKARILNSPIDLGKPGKERSVANHLGLFIRP